MLTIGAGLEFNEEKHEYRIDGIRVPSVTEIAGMISGSRFVERAPVIEAAAARGSAVHELCELYDWGDLPEEIDPALAGYLKAYIQFCKDYQVQWEYIELPLGSLCGFAGKLDRVGIIDGKRVVVDIKTTGTLDRVAKLMLAIQLAGYSELCNSNGISPNGEKISVCDCFGLQLRDNGTYKVHSVLDICQKYEADPTDMFRSLLSVAKILYGRK